jgi:hypothetical protein
LHSEKEVEMENQSEAVLYEPPMLVQLGKFSEDTLGDNGGSSTDPYGWFHWVIPTLNN